MIVDLYRLEIALAERQMAWSSLRHVVSPKTLDKVRASVDVRPAVVGRLASSLGVSVVWLLGDGEN